jgi:hypothetical protein
MTQIQVDCRTFSSMLNEYLLRMKIMASSGILRRLALIRTDVSEELSASFIKVTKIDEL